MAIKAVYGGGSINPIYTPTDEAVTEVLSALKREGIVEIDTARLYPGSEELIGKQELRTSFEISTKIPGSFGKASDPLATLTKENINKASAESLQRLNLKQVDIYYLHCPDPDVPIEETLEGINEVYKKGAFKRFGLSNYTAEEVQNVYDISKSKGWVLPTVFQGNYNPLSRKIETELFPVLRKLNIAFYAYSPLAGGFLTKTLEQIDEGAGRFNEQALGGLYLKLYNRPAFREALVEWAAIAEKEGISKAELAYRWVGYNSALSEEAGDGVIFGASKIEQLEQTARGLKKGKLSEEAATRIDEIWKKVEEDSFSNNYTVGVQGQRNA